MKHYPLLKHISALIAFVAIIFSVTPQIAHADGSSTLCYTLAPKDCQILTTAEANVSKEKSFQSDFAMTLAANSAAANITSSAKGTMLLSYDPTALTNLDALTKSLTLKLDGNASVQTTGLNLTPGLSQTTSTAQSSGSTSALSQKSSFGLVFLGDILYINTNSPLGWAGYQVNAQTMKSFSNDFNTGFNNALANPSGQSNLTPATTAALKKFLADPSIPEFLASLPTIQKFVTLKKTGNAPYLDGQNQIEFVYTYNLAVLLKSHEFHPVLKAFMAASAAATNQTTQFTDIQLDDIAILLSRLLPNSTITLTRWVGAKDTMFHALMFDISLNFVPGVLASSGFKPGTFKTHFEVKLTKLNQPLPTIEAPADALLFITPSVTPTDIPSATPTASDTPIPSATPTKTATATNTNTSVPSATSSNTPLPTKTNTPIPSATQTTVPTSVPAASTVSASATK